MNCGRALRVGIDVGGTFTDLVAIEAPSGEVITQKLPTTPAQPHRAIIEALRGLLARYESPPPIAFLAHATTIATNALLGQVGLELPRVALITTQGFADFIEIGRQNRSEVYNLLVERPRPLVAREDRFGVRERVDYRGNVLVPLDDDSLAYVCDELRSRNVGAVAICLLHAYANESHERRIVEVVREALPHARVSRSSEIDPQYREYERCSTTVVNAALSPLVERYLTELTNELEKTGVAVRLYVMRSDGGMSAASHLLARPAAIIESGPASGATAAAALARRLHAPRLLAFDMGGTTAKAGAVLDGVVQVVGEFEAAGKTHSGRAVKGSGYPVRFPFADLAEISAGGGTIAWLDDAGSLRVGPTSAGADPGPACYGKSETPTVTDANVVLGRLNPRYLLGGSFAIDADRARAAIEKLAARLGTSVEAAANGIVTLIDNAMAKVLRIVTIERGFDPRDFTLVAFGGGGPMHACSLAAELGIEGIVIPAHPGLFSAFGLLNAQLHASDVWSILRVIDELDIAALESAFISHEVQARVALVEQGAQTTSIRFRRECDARYRGQSFELAIAYDASPAELAQRFHDAHRGRYGYDAADEVIEIVNARLTATGAAAAPAPPARATPERKDAAPTTRRVWLDNAFVEMPVFERLALRQSQHVAGPAIVEAYDTTAYVAPGWSLRVDGDLLLLQRAKA